jgi:hypothetical protein
MYTGFIRDLARRRAGANNRSSVGGPPALLVTSGELKVVALAGHPCGPSPDTSPRIHPLAEGMEGAVVRGRGAPGEPDRCYQQAAALINHWCAVSGVRPVVSSTNFSPCVSVMRKICAASTST